MMTIPPTVQMGMALDEFVRLYDQEGPFELIRGERIPKLPTVARHNVTARAAFVALYTDVQQKQSGEVFSEAPFILPGTYSPNWVKDSRIPDVMFISSARLSAYKAQTPDWQDKPFIIVPDLVIEIVSPNDRFSEVNDKIDLYRADGVRLIWLIDPQRQTVAVYTPEHELPDIKRLDDTLDGSDVLPGFTLPVRQLFSEA
jgi:Uma2 family endonuclease